MAAPQSNARIVEKVDENQLVTLRGNTPPPAISKNDLGRVSPQLRMTDLILVLQRSPEQQAAFDAFVASQYDSTSPNFHQWLQPAEVGEKFGPALADIASITSWLTGHGLSVDEVSKDRMTIRFSGTAAQVEGAFHTEIHNLSVKGEQHIGNMSDPQIPMALSPVVVGVKALHDFHPRPLHRLGGKATLNHDTGKWEHVADLTTAGKTPIANTVRPNPEMGLTGGTAPNTYQVEDVTPYDFATIYNVLPLWNAASPIDGTGQTVAVVGTSDINLADVTSFRSTFGLPAGLTPIIKVANGKDPGRCASTASPSTANNYCTLDDQIENALDVEWSGAVAKGAQIVLVVSGAQSASDDTVFDSANYAVQNNTAKILNVSYGLCELGLGTSGNTTYNNLWQTAAAQGIAVFVATGDSGSPACDQGGDAAGTPYAAQYGLSVSGLASTQYNTAVGGTDLNWGNTAAPYWNSTNDANNASNAIGYMPEIPWNASCTNPVILPDLQNLAKQLQKAGYNATSPTDAESACNFVVKWNSTLQLYGVNISFIADTVGAGGGESNCTTSDGQTVATCTGGYPTPSWQTGVSGIPADGKRYIPDVSFFASNGFLGSAYLICVSDWEPAGSTCITKTTTTEPMVGEIGGTSAASPAMAGVMALINQKAGGPQGSPNAELYKLGAKQSYSSCSSETGTTSNGCYFNDVDQGTISMPCMPGSPNCTVKTSGDAVGVLTTSGGTVAYNAAAGFDLATGLGTLNVANVVNGWVASIGTAKATVTVTPAQNSIVSNVALAVTGTVTGSSGTPTGTVILVGGGYASASTTLSNTGAYSITIPANSLSAGTDTLTVTYSGDATYAIASATANVTVTAPPTPMVTVTPASSSIVSNVTLAVSGTVSGSSGTPTGTVTLSGGGYTSAVTPLSSGAYSITIPANSLSVGTDTLTVKYSGDAVYGTATGTASVTVTAAASTFTLSASAPPAISKGSTATSTITVASTNGYSGTVTLACTASSTNPANSATDAPTCTVSSGGIAVGKTGTATVTTKAAVAALEKPKFFPWEGAGGGAVLALLVFLGIPARRRSWLAMLGALVLMIVLGSLAACGGGGSSGGGGGGTSDPGTASGTYTFTVTGTGTPAVSPSPTTTFTVTVN
jgi:subtilase family serine protease